MSDTNEQTTALQVFEKEPSSGLVSLAYIIYALHGFSALTGTATSAFVVTTFLTGIPSIIAVILSYAKKDDARGTYLESHFEWVIATFWYAAVAIVISLLLFITFIGIPLSYVLMVFTGLWVLYRITRGIFALMDEKPLPMD